MAGMHLGPGRPLLATSVRQWAGVLVICCAMLVAVLGVLFAHQAAADSLDHAVDSPVIAWLGTHRGLLTWLAAPGSLIPAAVLAAAIAVACLLAGRLNGAVLVVVALPVAVGLDDSVLKPLVHRTYLGQLSYPSGHTTAVFTLATAVTVVLLSPPRPSRARPLRVVIPAVAVILGGIVAVGVIGLRWHYFTDTVAGAAVGIGAVCGLALVLDLPVLRRRLFRAGRHTAAAPKNPPALSASKTTMQGRRPR